MKPAATFSELLQGFFTDSLMGQCNASPLTIANYRDAFCLLIAYAERCLKKPPAKLAVQDLDAAFITRFLDYVERERGNCARTRNTRLAAIHSFFTYAALHEPSAAAVAQRVLAIKSKRCPKKPVDFLTRAESNAVLSMPDQTTWAGRRDRTLLLVASQTGLRVSELIGLRCQDVTLEAGAHVRCTGKGRTTRCIPLRKEVVGALRQWLRERDGQPADAVFTNARSQPLGRDGVQYILAQLSHPKHR
jgi:site-specific recombinase XerD